MLDNKLRKILSTFLDDNDGLWDQFMEGDDPDPQKYDEFSDNAVNEAASKLKQAFADEYAGVNHVLNTLPVDNKWHGVQFNAKRPGDKVKDVSTYEVMTGQEWYERFAKEMYFYIAAKDTDRDYEVLDRKSILEAARKAGGIS